MKYLIYIFTPILGLFVGVGSALWMSGLIGDKSWTGPDSIDVNGWQSDWSIGSSTANPYTRALVARRGLLALSKQEAVYFTLSLDRDGEPLNETCRYELSGEGLDALWWSITLYDADSRLPMNKDMALSIDATMIGDAKTWTAIIAPERPIDAHWISSRKSKQFDLTLRLYRPSQDLLDSPQDHLNPPAIRRIDCPGKAGT